MILTPKNWKSFQHYKDRSPSWIKLHKALLDDYEFACLPVASKALAPLLWLLASEYEDGKITASLDELAFRLRMTRGDMADALNPLLEKGFFDASEPLADRKHDASLEKRREEEEIEEEKEKNTRVAALVFESDWPRDYREEFWREYPKRIDKAAAFKKLEQLRRAGNVPWGSLIAGVRRYAGKVRGRDPTYTKGPAAWLNAGKWDDEDAPSYSIDEVCPPEIYRNVL